MKGDSRILHKLIPQAIELTGLDLTGLSVLCEAGSGNYRFAPVIAAMAQAGHVFAVTKDHPVYGPADMIQWGVREMLTAIDLYGRVTFIQELTPAIVSSADIICNSGHLRPIDVSLVSWMKSRAVVPLMFETWELNDVDVEACHAAGVMTMGTDEHHHSLQLFRSNFFLLAKLLFEQGFGLYKDRVLICGFGPLGQSLADLLSVVRCQYDVLHTTITARDALADIDTFDAVVVADLSTKTMYVADDGYLPPKELAKNDDLLLVHIAGGVRQEDIDRSGLTYIPQQLAVLGKMSVTADELGPRTVIELVTAGLSVGATMARVWKTEMDLDVAILKVMQLNPLAMPVIGGWYD